MFCGNLASGDSECQSIQDNKEWMLAWLLFFGKSEIYSMRMSSHNGCVPKSTDNIPIEPNLVDSAPQILGPRAGLESMSLDLRDKR